MLCKYLLGIWGFSLHSHSLMQKSTKRNKIKNTFLACLAARIYHKTCKDSFTNTPKTRFSVRISLSFNIIVIILANIMMLYTHKCQS